MKKQRSFIVEIEKQNLDCMISAMHTIICVTLLASAGIYMYGELFPDWMVEPYQWWKTVSLGLIIILFFEVLQPIFLKKRYWRWMVGSIPFIACGIAVWKKYEEIEKYMPSLVEEYFIYINKCMKTNYHMMDMKPDAEPRMFLFCITVLLIVILVLQYICKREKILLLFPVLPLGLSMLVDKVPSGKSLIFLFVGILFLNSGEWKKQTIKKVKEKNIAFGQKIIGFVVIAFSLSVVLGGSFFLLEKPAQKILKRNKFVKEFQVNLEQTVASYTSFSTEDMNVNNRTPQYRDRKILTMYRNRLPATNQYLKGKVAEVYQNGSWCQEENRILSAYQQAGFDQSNIWFLYQLGYLSQKDSINKQIKYTLEYHTNETISYTPYFTDVLEIVKSNRMSKDSIFYKADSEKTRSFQGWELQSSLGKYVGIQGAKQDASGNWEIVGDIPLLYDEEQMQDGSLLYTNEEQKHTEELPQVAKNMIQWYEKYVREVYGVPSNELPSVVEIAESKQMKALRNDLYYDEKDRMWENIYRVAAAEQVRLELAKRCTYSMKLDRITDGTDTVQYFLTKGRKGYCMHFASAGVLILRQLHVPARYVSGYVVSAKSFSKQKDGTYKAEVIDRNAHAWVEIYLNGMGWIPVEMTPGYREDEKLLPTQMNEQQLEEMEKEQKEKTNILNGIYSEMEETEKNEQSIERQEGEKTIQEKRVVQKEIQNEERKTQDKQKKNQQKLRKESDIEKNKKRLFCMLEIVIVVLLIVLILFRRKYYKWYQKKIENYIKREEYATAIVYINRKIYKNLLRKKKCMYYRLTDKAYELELSRQFQEVSMSEWKRYVQILQKNHFSMEEILLEDVEFCAGILYQVMKKRDYVIKK